MAFIVDAKLPANQAVGIESGSGHRQVVIAGSYGLVSEPSFTLDLLTKGVGGRPPQVLKLGSVSGGRLTPLLGLPVTLRTVPLSSQLTVIVVEGHSGSARDPCHLVTCPASRLGERPVPAHSNGEGHCLCPSATGPKIIDPMGWTPVYGMPNPIIGPGGGPTPGGRPNVPNVIPVANTDRVNPCAIVLDADMVNGPEMSLGQCLASVRGPGALAPEPTPSPYAASYSSEPMVNPFALDAIY